MAGQPTLGSSVQLPQISLQGTTLEEIEGMEISALREALKSVVREEGSLCMHNNHGSHSNSHGNSITRDEEL